MEGAQVPQAGKAEGILMRSSNADAVRVAEISISFLSGTKVEAKAALVAKGRGETFGWITLQNWSPATLLILKQLRESMEEDAEKMFFAEPEEVQPIPYNGSGSPPVGIGETLGLTPYPNEKIDKQI